MLFCKLFTKKSQNISPADNFIKLLHFTNCLFCDTIGLRRFYSGSICRSKGAVIMEQFKYYAPTKILFGKNTEAEVGELCKTQGASKVLVHFGGSSAKKSGLLDRVCGALQEAGLPYVTLGGVVPNPRLSKVYEGIEICRREKVDFILAVGGGSVIDSAKAIGYGITNPGDVWDYYSGKAPQAWAPIGAVLTIAAAGSEMSNASVITNEDGWLKRGLQSPYAYCKFAILNPELTCTLPAYQTASGCTDIIVHTLERYFTKPGVTSLALTDGMAEALLRNVMRNARLALQTPDDYDVRAEIMWAGTLSHNDITGDRSQGDWASHQLEHELGGMFDIAHGAGLAAIWGSWARYVLKQNPCRFAQLAVNVLNVPYSFGNDEKTALEGIAAMEDFFRSIGMPTSISDMEIELTDAQIKELAHKCSFMGRRTIGGFVTLNAADMENIYRMAR